MRRTKLLDRHEKSTAEDWGGCRYCWLEKGVVYTHCFFLDIVRVGQTGSLTSASGEAVGILEGDFRLDVRLSSIERKTRNKIHFVNASWRNFARAI